MENGGSVQIKNEISKTILNIQNSFHSSVNAFTTLERKCDEIVGKISPGMEESNLISTL